MPIVITRYDHACRDIWNDFVRKAKNSTFLFEREYMDYHSDRFCDCSLIFERNGKILALLPANIEENALVSHRGLTYGGLIMGCHTKTTDVIDIFKSLTLYIKEILKVEKIIYKPLPHIYCQQPSEEPLYALTLLGAKISARAISTTIDNGNRLPIEGQRSRGVKKAVKAGITCNASNNYEAFWNILDEVLQSRHNTTPVHTIDEIRLLQSRFPKNIKLFTANNKENILAGIVVYETENVAHLQYIAASPQGKEVGALDALITHLTDNVYSNKHYIDFGISTEQGGTLLNEGLIAQKEGFGGRAIVYDTYEMQTQ